MKNKLQLKFKMHEEFFCECKHKSAVELLYSILKDEIPKELKEKNREISKVKEPIEFTITIKTRKKDEKTTKKEKKKLCSM